MKFKQIKDDIMEAMQATKPKTSPYDTEAEVIRVDGSTAWVHIPGGVAETPVSLTIAAQAGDTVRVRVSGGGAWLVGNDTAPPTDDTTAVAAQTEAKAAKVTAESAAKIAGNTDQHFWMVETGTDTGAHITEVTREKFLADPANGGGNLLARSNGIAVRDGLTELATFSASGAQIGLESGAHSEIDADGQRFYGGTNGQTQLANIGYGEGAYMSGTAVAPYYSLGVRASGSVVGNYSMAEGYNTTSSGYTSHAEGFGPTASGRYSHAEGKDTMATGLAAHAEGVSTVANADASHAEGEYTLASETFAHAEGGRNTTASGSAAHAEGRNTLASNVAAHSEGSSTIASGEYAHAEGIATTASGLASHAQNSSTVAAYENQTAIGVLNDNQSDTAVEIGNGANGSRSNALDVNWNGEVRLALDTTASAGTTDGDLYAAITAAGWASEVIV